MTKTSLKEAFIKLEQNHINRTVASEAETKKRLGIITIDSGTILIADPCYWIGQNKSSDWSNFCQLLTNSKDYTAISHGYRPNGSVVRGKGIAVYGGINDGAYDVYGTYAGDRLKSIEIIISGE